MLGLPAITALNIVARVNTIDKGFIESQKEIVLRKYPDLFRGLGNLGEAYTFKLRADAKVHALFTARKIPLPLRDRVKEELDMTSMGVISQLENLQCGAGMVPVPKKNRKIRICVNMKRLNESMLREVYHLPQVDDALAQLTGARIFSKLDARSGFWQNPLAEES